MESDQYQDLPSEIIERLRHLELEYEDGDITLKGFEKKKASLLADYSSNPTTPTSPTPDEAAILDEYGPEPSAADVVDFLDYLPSPTHSPVRTEGATLMEENHVQLLQQQYQPSSPQNRSSIIQPPYRPYVRPVYNNNNRPYMVPRNGYPSNMIPQPNMMPYMYGNNPRPIQPQPQPMYRPTNNQQYPQRPMMYQRPIPTHSSPRPMYNRPINYNRPQPPHHLPPQPPPQQQQQYRDMQYGNSNYGVNRSLSTNTGMTLMTGKMRQDYVEQRQYNTMSMYSPRSDSDWDQ